MYWIEFNVGPMDDSSFFAMMRPHIRNSVMFYLPTLDIKFRLAF